MAERLKTVTPTTMTSTTTIKPVKTSTVVTTSTGRKIRPTIDYPPTRNVPNIAKLGSALERIRAIRRRNRMRRRKERQEKKMRRKLEVATLHVDETLWQNLYLHAWCVIWQRQKMKRLRKTKQMSAVTVASDTNVTVDIEQLRQSHNM